MATPTAAMLLERERELVEVDGALTEVARGHGQLVLVEAPAGLGKTSLLRAAEEAAAVEGLARRSPLAVELRVNYERVAAAVETAIYFTVAEALTNVAKHAQATHATVTIEIDDGALIAQIEDDGLGGASTTAGSGLRGLADRLDALGGTLSIESPRGGPTIIRARARCIARGRTRPEVDYQPRWVGRSRNSLGEQQ